VNKELRQRIKQRFGGRCAYCGLPLTDSFQVDHVKPIYRGRLEKPEHAGEDVEENLFPACPRCNRAKSTFTIEKFRQWIKRADYQLFRDEPKYRLLKDYGIITVNKIEVKFYFEKYQELRP
jgi:5-methylcytosine-specific restriction endonuclease McrA